MKMKKINPIIVFLVLLFGMIIFPYLPMELFHFNLDNLPEKMRILYNFICDLGFIIIVFLVYKDKIIKEYHEYFNNFKIIFKKSLSYYLIGLAIMIISNTLIGLFFNGANAGNEDTIRSLIHLYPAYMLFSVSIYAPFVEETIFRRSIKDIFTTSKNTTLTKYLYIILSGLIFGLMHVLGQASVLDYLFIIPYASLGCAFAALYDKTNNLFSTIILHSLHNTITIILYLWLGV